MSAHGTPVRLQAAGCCGLDVMNLFGEVLKMWNHEDSLLVRVNPSTDQQTDGLMA